MVEPTPNPGPIEDDSVEDIDGVTVVPMSAWSMLPLGPPGAVTSPAGVGTSAAGRDEALERRRRRLAEQAGLDPGRKEQAELPLEFTYWRPVRWTVESRWTKRVARELCPDDNPWHGHPAFLDCTTAAIARNACRMLKRRFPGKQYRLVPSRWVDDKGNRFPSALPPTFHR